MTVVPLQCPLCNGAIQVDAAHAGAQVACPHCQGLITVPDFGRQPPAPPESSAYDFNRPRTFGFDPLKPPAMESALNGVAPPPPPPPIGPAGEILSLHCPHCSGLFQAPLTAAGYQVGCPHCAGLVTLPPLGPRLGSPPPAPSPAPPGMPSLPSSDRLAMEHKRDDRLQPTKASPAAPTRRTTVLDTILPPGSGEAPPSEIAPGQEVTLPEAPRRPAPVPANTPAGPVVVPTPDGGYATLRKKAKTVGKGDSEIELKELSSEEKAKKRFRYNLIMWSICAFILSVVFVVLVWPAIRR